MSLEVNDFVRSLRNRLLPIWQRSFVRPFLPNQCWNFRASHATPDIHDPKIRRYLTSNIMGFTLWPFSIYSLMYVAPLPDTIHLLSASIRVAFGQAAHSVLEPSLGWLARAKVGKICVRKALHYFRREIIAPLFYTEICREKFAYHNYGFTFCTWFS